MVSDDIFFRLVDVLDRMDGAAQRVLTALPSQMTAAAAELDAARISMRAEFNAAMLASARATLSHKEGGRNG